MTEYEALLAAIGEEPDEDTLRLAFADWLDEYGEPERAAFVRAQVELARTPPWEPFAVFCKWRRTDWTTGHPFLSTLPAVDGSQLEWPPESFRRGLPWRIFVRSLHAWREAEARVLAATPIGEMHLWGAAMLDEWTQFAESPILRRLRRVHFRVSPIEPLRAIRERPEALGITDLYFDRSTGAGMPEVLEDLFASPLGRVVSGIHFRLGYEGLDHLMFVLGEARKLERLSFSSMGLTADHIQRLGATGVLGGLTELHLRKEHLGYQGVRTLVESLSPGMRDLALEAVRVESEGVEGISQADRLSGLQRLDLSNNQLAPRAMKVLRRSRSLTRLRSLILENCRLDGKSLRHLTRAKFWPNLVEVDLRGNSISGTGFTHLMDAPVPRDLTALVLNDHAIGQSARDELGKKYGDRLVLVRNFEM